jgi:diaminopimelate epimerase
VSKPTPAIPFVKASACGNDFLLIDLKDVEGVIAAQDLAEFTQRVCDRHEGVGADGVEWLYPHETADIEIRLINADGSSAEISGNGTRCVAAYICAKRHKEKIAIQTGAGVKTCVLISKTDSDYEFEVEMGEAAVGAELTLQIGRSGVRGIPVSMGNPHYVVFVSEFAANWREQAVEIQHNPEFTQGVNVEMVVVDGPHDVRALFFERGAGETRSSGTGSCASAVASIAARKAQSPVRVHAPGGTQTVRREENHIFLRGTACLVCKGDFFLT